MRLIGLAVVLGLSLTLAPFAVEAQPAGKVWRIGVLAHSTQAAAAGPLEVFRQGLRDLGYVEGKNIAIEIRLEERQDRLDERAAELVRLGVDLMVATGTPASLAARRATGTIPIVMTAVADPVQSGLVTSLARPTGSVTGNSVLTAEMMVKQPELLREAVPKASRIAALWNSSNPALASFWKDTEAAARTLGLKVQPVEVRGAGDLDRALAELPTQHVDALLISSDPVVFIRTKQIVDAALVNRLPTIALNREVAATGGLMSYGPSFSELVYRSTRYIDRIFKGAKPADLPVEQPTKFELVVNLKTAKALGLTIPQSVLLRADHIIE